MFSKSYAVLVVLAIASLSQPVLGHDGWLERDNHPVFLRFRRFGEQPAVLDQLAAFEPATKASVTRANTLLFGTSATRKRRNNQSSGSSENSNSVNNDSFDLEDLLNGLDDHNDDEEVVEEVEETEEIDSEGFDEFDGSSIIQRMKRRSSVPFAGLDSNLLGRSDLEDVSSGLNAVTVTASVTSLATGTISSPSAAVTVVSGDSSDFGDFGSCSVPQIEFGVGFDNRKETSFQPVDEKSFDHSSADNIDIITQFICDTLTNSCGADQTAKDTCAQAEAAADAQTAKTGAQADAFNAAFGIQTNFASIQAIDDQGNVVSGSGASASAAVTTAAAAATTAAAQAVSSAAAVTPPAATATASAAQATAAAASSLAAGDFGSCSVPQIKFGVGFDNRKETSFEPADQTSFNHGSADNIDIITKFICDTLTNSCGADQAAKDACTQAEAAADTQTAKTGAQADAFNAVFGITTNFAAVAAIDDQGNVVAGTGSASAAQPAAASAAPATATPTVAPTAAPAAATPAAATPAAAASSAVGNFGSCSVPEIQFGVGFDGRKETSFEPVDQKSFNHGSADNIAVITQFICDTLTNSCKADQTAKDTCASAQTAANGATAKTGAQADGIFPSAASFCGRS
ncbi:hypothetical protein FA95DRAFT_803598 [Auriscalpium vulgare]|uniref:Uncharacterized protein n=1 Tax=Auriscalpium vulgare TaxID=40419 RepID=A0ACB8S0Z6_9AGAM|nr:hypothetical protein FA95DRAFT_803598 [Auriscalpium vulgare]